MTEKITLYQIRLTQPERDALTRLAKLTGRTRANVIRRMIRAAADDPAYLRLLGALPLTEEERNDRHNRP